MDIWTIEFWTEFFSKAGPVIILLGVFIGFILKLRTFLKKLSTSKDEIWKEKMVRRILKALGTGEILDILLILTDLLKVIPAEDLCGLVIDFREKHD